jgi:hypothetical protein
VCSTDCHAEYGDHNCVLLTEIGTHLLKGDAGANAVLMQAFGANGRGTKRERPSDLPPAPSPQRQRSDQPDQPDQPSEMTDEQREILRKLQAYHITAIPGLPDVVIQHMIEHTDITPYDLIGFREVSKTAKEFVEDHFVWLLMLRKMEPIVAATFVSRVLDVGQQSRKYRRRRTTPFIPPKYTPAEEQDLTFRQLKWLKTILVSLVVGEYMEWDVDKPDRSLDKLTIKRLFSDATDDQDRWLIYAFRDILPDGAYEEKMKQDGLRFLRRDFYNRFPQQSMLHTFEPLPFKIIFRVSHEDLYTGQGEINRWVEFDRDNPDIMVFTGPEQTKKVVRYSVMLKAAIDMMMMDGPRPNVVTFGQDFRIEQGETSPPPYRQMHEFLTQSEKIGAFPWDSRWQQVLYDLQRQMMLLSHNNMVPHYKYLKLREKELLPGEFRWMPHYRKSLMYSNRFYYFMEKIFNSVLVDNNVIFRYAMIEIVESSEASRGNFFDVRTYDYRSHTGTWNVDVPNYEKTGILATDALAHRLYNTWTQMQRVYPEDKEDQGKDDIKKRKYAIAILMFPHY